LVILSSCHLSSYLGTDENGFYQRLAEESLLQLPIGDRGRQLLYDLGGGLPCLGRGCRLPERCERMRLGGMEPPGQR